MKKEIKEIDVKELVKDINDEDNFTEKEIKTTSRPKAKAKYEVVFSSGCDFAINRQTARTNKTLVLIFSQNMCYIYDEILGKKLEMTEALETELKSFFSDKAANDIIIKKDTTSCFGKDLRKSEIPFLCQLMTYKEPGLRFLIKKGYSVLKLVSSRWRSYFTDVEDCYNDSPALLNYFWERIGAVEESICQVVTKLNFVTDIYEISNLDTAYYAVDAILRSSVMIDRRLSDKLKELIINNRINVKRFIDFLLFDMYRQGKAHLTRFLHTYEDYLELCKSYYGNIPDKYPKFLETQHNQILAKVTELESIKSESPEFAEIMMNSENYAYFNPFKSFVIRMPKESGELVEEGSKLSHCVSSYVEKVNRGDCIVVFMRKKETPDEPYLTVEILPDRSVPQVEGLCRRTELTEEEIHFLNQWAKNKHLKLTAANVPVLKKERKKAC